MAVASSLSASPTTLNARPFKCPMAMNRTAQPDSRLGSLDQSGVSVSLSQARLGLALL